MTQRVFVVQEPLMKAPGTGDLIRKMDLTPAKEFGELKFLIDWSSLKNGINPAELYWTMRTALEEENYHEDDFILLIGHPIAMSVAFRVATERCKRIQMLNWDRHNSEYNVVVFDREEL
jgi:hypothetical protein